MKNIWIINHYAKPYVGRHYKFAENLIKDNYNVKVICASTSMPMSSISFTKWQTKKEIDVNGISYSIIKTREYFGNGWRRIKNMIDFSYRTYANERKEKKNIPEIIYASSVHPLSWVVGYLLSKKFETKLIIETRDLWPETLIRMGRIKEKSLVAKFMYRLEKFIYEKADYLIFTMPGGEDYLKSREIKYKNAVNINNGVDLIEYNKNLNKYHYSLNKLNNSFNVVYTGAMGIANAVGQILEAAKCLNDQKYFDIHFHFFGEGYEKGRYINYADENHLKNVTFYGRVDKKYIPSILGQSDLNIVTSQNLSIYNYGISLNKLFDYFASGKPVLSNIPTPYNKVEKYGCGLTVKPDSIDNLVKGILYFYNMDKSDYNFYCENALRTAEKFDYRNLTLKVENVITDCTRRRI